jgi:hypothetical protein
MRGVSAVSRSFVGWGERLSIFETLCFGGGSESLCRNAAGRSDDGGEIKQQIWNLVECTTQRE